MPEEGEIFSLQGGTMMLLLRWIDEGDDGRRADREIHKIETELQNVDLPLCVCPSPVRFFIESDGV